MNCYYYLIITTSYWTITLVTTECPTFIFLTNHLCLGRKASGISLGRRQRRKVGEVKAEKTPKARWRSHVMW
jgi:hypothetical protein